MKSFSVENFVVEFRYDSNIENFTDTLLHCENGLEAALLALKVAERLSPQERRILIAWLEKGAE